MAFFKPPACYVSCEPATFTAARARSSGIARLHHNSNSLPLTTQIPPHLRHAPRQHEVQREPTTQTQLGTVSLHGRTVAANPTVENNPLREPTPWNRNANVNSPRVSGISQLRHKRNDKGVGYALLLGSDEPFPGSRRDIVAFTRTGSYAKLPLVTCATAGILLL